MRDAVHSKDISGMHVLRVWERGEPASESQFYCKFMFIFSALRE